MRPHSRYDRYLMAHVAYNIQICTDSYWIGENNSEHFHAVCIFFRKDKCTWDVSGLQQKFPYNDFQNKYVNILTWYTYRLCIRPNCLTCYSDYFMEIPFDDA